jgi:hypothetical protein
MYITAYWAKAGYCVRLVGRTLLRQECVAGESLRDRPDKITNVSGERKAGRMNGDMKMDRRGTCLRL